MSESSRPGNPTKTFLTELAAHLTAILTVSGLILFVVLSMLYEYYYSLFGVAPSDVGIGYIETLTKSYGYVAMLAVTSVAIFALVWGVGKAAEGLQAEKASTGQQDNFMRRLARFPSRHPIVFTLVYVAVYGLFLGYTLLSTTVERDVSGLMRTGHPISPYKWCSLTMLDVRALEAKLGQGTDAALARAYEGHKLRYLGSANRLYVLYDATDHKTVRLSVEKTTLLTAPGEKSC
jgi:hypothetical protein